ncbi:hypothetical protein K435DRAFT_419393 [Dendrothele bispora CBS 962.96]|nr:hypothetical protein K435DRAFT_419393 [Dendrothele bispora CBS 962.96]
MAVIIVSRIMLNIQKTAEKADASHHHHALDIGSGGKTSLDSDGPETSRSVELTTLWPDDFVATLSRERDERDSESEIGSRGV